MIERPCLGVQGQVAGGGSGIGCCDDTCRIAPMNDRGEALQMLQELQTFWMRVMGGVPGGVTTDEKPSNISLDM